MTCRDLGAFFAAFFAGGSDALAPKSGMASPSSSASVGASTLVPISWVTAGVGAPFHNDEVRPQLGAEFCRHRLAAELDQRHHDTGSACYSRPNPLSGFSAGN